MGIFNWFIKRDYRIPVAQDDWVAPEETLVDSASQLSDLERPIPDGTFRLAFFTAVALMGIILAYSFRLSVAQHEFFSALAFKNKTVNFSVPPSRGLILDRQGRPLVRNEPSFDVVVVSRELARGEQDRLRDYAAVAGIVGVAPDAFTDAVQADAKKNALFFAASDLTKEQALALKRLNPSGFYLITNTKRVYPNGQQFSSIIGYTGKVGKGDLSADEYYLPSDSIGRLGIEASYESYLRGTHGTIFFSHGGKSDTVQESLPGQSVVLTIDADMQKRLWNTLYEILRSAGLQSAAAIVQDPRSGAVLAMASFPSFDNNLLTGDVSSADFKKLFENKARPLFNRVISGLYNPGSTIKPFIALAALQERIITPTDTIRDCVSISIPNPFKPDEPYVFKNWRPDFGLFDLRRAIANSCNVYFFTVGGGYGSIAGLGVDRIVSYLTGGFANAVLGIDVPGEEHGFIPTPAWKLAERNDAWYQGDTYNISIGQGDLLVTPLWINSYVAAIANGGTLYKPRLVQRIVDGSHVTTATFPAQTLTHLPFSDGAIREVRAAMRETVLSGTARLLQDLPVSAAAKTGTAEVIKGRSINSLFTSFAPFENPEVAITVLVEGSSSNQGYAIRAAHDFLAWYFSGARSGEAVASPVASSSVAP